MIQASRFEHGGQPLVQPDWHHGSGEHHHHGVHELVGKHTFEFVWLVERVSDGQPDSPVVGASGPLRRLRHVPELLLGIEHHVDGLARVGGQDASHAPIRLFEHLDRAPGQTLIRRPLEQHAEVRPA